MRAWFGHHVRCFFGAFARLARAPLSTIANVVVIGIAAALPLAAYLVMNNVQTLAQQGAGEPSFGVFMTTDATKADIERVEGALKRAAGVRRVQFVPKDAALDRLRRVEGLADAIGVLKANPLPDAFVVSLEPGAAAAGERLAGELRLLPKISHVQLDATWLRRLEALLRLGRVVVWALGGLFGVALVAVIFNTVRLQLLGRVEEIAVSQLVGATDAFVRRPFCHYGAVLGLVGGLVGFGLVAAGVYGLNQPVASLASAYGSSFQVGFPGWRDLALSLAIPALLGLVGAFLSASAHLHHIHRPV
jgi:cell division transport system permease protein